MTRAPLFAAHLMPVRHVRAAATAVEDLDREGSSRPEPRRRRRCRCSATAAIVPATWVPCPQSSIIGDRSRSVDWPFRNARPGEHLAGEVGMAGVDAGVDDRDGDARCRVGSFHAFAKEVLAGSSAPLAPGVRGRSSAADGPHDGVGLDRRRGRRRAPRPSRRPWPRPRSHLVGDDLRAVRGRLDGHERARSAAGRGALVVGGLWPGWPPSPPGWAPGDDGGGLGRRCRSGRGIAIAGAAAATRVARGQGAEDHRAAADPVHFETLRRTFGPPVPYLAYRPSPAPT